MTFSYDPVKAGIRTMLLANSFFTTIPIYPALLSNILNPSFPCVTLSHRSGGTEKHWLGKDTAYQIDVFTKGPDFDVTAIYLENDGLWTIYNQIEETINLKKMSNITTFLIKEIDVDDDLFEEDTRTWHLASIYKIMYETKGVY